MSVDNRLPTNQSQLDIASKLDDVKTAIENISISGSSTFSALTDVSISNIQNGQVPKWNSTTSKWENDDEAGGTTVVANPVGTATADLTKLQVGSDIYDIPTGGGASTEIIADDFDATSTYAVGDYCIYDGKLYKCTTAVSTAGDWDSSDWTETLVMDEVEQGGGGGTGGHTIIDENGTSMTARAGLQFIGGANVSDDSTNNKTVVDLASAGGIDGVFVDTNNVIVGRTQISTPSSWSYTAQNDCIMCLEMSASSSSTTVVAYIDNNRIAKTGGTTGIGISFALKKGQTVDFGSSSASSNNCYYTVYGIRTGTTHSKFQPVIYSTEEREIGVYKDGKPLYEKTFTFSQVQSGANSWFDTNVGISSFNIDTFADTILIGTSNSGDILYPAISSKTSNNTLQCMHFRNANANFVGAIVRYTKTTDTAGSGTWTPQGVPAVHYSTDEQIIGTWVDGKTLYQRSYSANWGTSVTYINLDFTPDTIMFVPDATFKKSTSDGNTCYLGYYASADDQCQAYYRTSDNCLVCKKVGSNFVGTGYITIQYTKSTS